jgi:hypothetical protein
MSLDLYLYGVAGQVTPPSDSSGIFIRAGGEMFEITRAEWDRRHPGIEPAMVKPQPREEDNPPVLWSQNITHNLGKMASEAGLYATLWRPDENGITHARDAIADVDDGLRLLKQRPKHFKQFNPENGWGDYELLVRFTESFLEACKRFPGATVYACR